MSLLASSLLASSRLTSSNVPLGVLNIGTCCCVIGLPIGIWSLVVLLNEEVKSAFS